MHSVHTLQVLLQLDKNNGDLTRRHSCVVQISKCFAKYLLECII
jgi:hypothetical protein